MPRDPAAKAVAPLLPVETALDRILQGLGPQAAASVPLADASGRILADNIAATVSLPAHDLSAMDGYAVKSADCQPGAPLTRIGEPIALAELERSGAELARYLNVPLEGV